MQEMTTSNMADFGYRDRDEFNQDDLDFLIDLGVFEEEEEEEAEE